MTSLIGDSPCRQPFFIYHSCNSEIPIHDQVFSSPLFEHWLTITQTTQFTAHHLQILGLFLVCAHVSVASAQSFLAHILPWWSDNTKTSICLSFGYDDNCHVWSLHQRILSLGQSALQHANGQKVSLPWFNAEKTWSPSSRCSKW